MTTCDYVSIPRDASHSYTIFMHKCIIITGGDRGFAGGGVGGVGGVGVAGTQEFSLRY